MTKRSFGAHLSGDAKCEAKLCENMSAVQNVRDGAITNYRTRMFQDHPQLYYYYYYYY